MIRTMKNSTTEEQLTSELQRKFGPLIGGANLVQCLGYSTPSAFRQALRRGQLPVHVFTIENRRGQFAKTIDVESWIASLS